MPLSRWQVSLGFVILHQSLHFVFFAEMYLKAIKFCKIFTLNSIIYQRVFISVLNITWLLDAVINAVINAIMSPQETVLNTLFHALVLLQVFCV